MDLADTPTPPPQEGEWTLTAPDGRSWKARAPVACVSKEMRERVPADVGLARIMRAVTAPTDTERMDWLCKQTVEVRTTLRYGSRPNFFASPDLEEDHSDLRRRVDIAMQPQTTGDSHS